MGDGDATDWSDSRLIALEVVTLASCFASVFGSTMIMLSYLFFKDLRTTSRKMLVYLSCCDLVTASGNAVGVIIKPSGSLCTGNSHSHYFLSCR